MSAPYGWSLEGISSKAGKAWLYLSMVGRIFSATLQSQRANKGPSSDQMRTNTHAGWLREWRRQNVLRNPEKMTRSSQQVFLIIVNEMKVKVKTWMTYWSPRPESSFSGCHWHAQSPLITNQWLNPKVHVDKSTQEHIKEALHLVPNDCYEIPVLVWSCGRHPRRLK